MARTVAIFKSSPGKKREQRQRTHDLLIFGSFNRRNLTDGKSKKKKEKKSVITKLSIIFEKSLKGWPH